jgi:hypothetical protein
LSLTDNCSGLNYLKGDKSECCNYVLEASDLNAMVLRKGLHYLSYRSDGTLVLIGELHAPRLLVFIWKEPTITNQSLHAIT